jgi:DNA-binding protein YbaB
LFILLTTKADLNDSKFQLSRVQSQLANAQSQLSNTEADLINTKLQLTSTQAALTNFQKQLQSTQAKLTDVQVQLATLQTSITKPAPMVIGSSYIMQGTGLPGPGAQEMVVTATILNNGGHGKVTVTAKLTGSQASQSGSTSLFLEQSEQQDVTVIIPGALANETLTVTAQ